jgi:hypothetical protein
MCSASLHQFAHRLRNRLLVLTLVVGTVLSLSVGTVFIVTDEVDARARTIHPCLLGDEPCNTPVPTPKPRWSARRPASVRTARLGPSAARLWSTGTAVVANAISFVLRFRLFTAYGENRMAG